MSLQKEKLPLTVTNTLNISVRRYFNGCCDAVYPIYPIQSSKAMSLNTPSNFPNKVRNIIAKKDRPVTAPNLHEEFL